MKFHVPSGDAIQCRDIAVRYGSRMPWILSGLSFEVRPGELAALRGPNGSGKTTLFRILTGQLLPERGCLSVLGTAPGSTAHRVAYLSQSPATRWDFPITTRRLVETGRYAHIHWFGRFSANDAALVDSALQLAGLANQADLPIGHLSGGQRRRCLIARALVQEAELLLLDEPTNALDSSATSSLIDTLLRLREAGKAILLATHDAQFPLDTCDRVVQLAPPVAGAPHSPATPHALLPCNTHVA